ncbi:HsdM family class I SAM-dependent methyltransferase [Aliarcobacter butzleri]|uniref:HsdM family class I SAM-dependent methyltransferase n=1 Tax=Aliarcobacter butzleri TaxID=28197 RepID=UPI00263F20F5|nr:N-6 DNA methylase [Aliarcobacter butzleri]MDN5048582.1 N-6 DNA methylase [Aliarcobacter butzleri]MDN5056684.1 N-6 DNA methylase [Aliarcobacter butzleri]
MNKEVLNFLRNYTYDENSINRLLLSSYMFKNDILNIKNKTIQSLLIEKESLEYSILQSFLGLLEHDIKMFDFEYLLELFEFVISPSDKLINGAIYTPENIRNYITKQSFNELTHKSIDNIKIADIACGCGGFLIDASLELKQRTNKSFKKIFHENIFGVDIQEYSIERTKILLSLLAITHGEDEKEFQFNLYIADSLEFEWLKEDEQIKKNNGFDLILGNPPYVCSRNMDEKTKELMQKWSTCKTGHPDLYIPFFQIGYELLTPNGILGFITVNTFMHSVNGRAIREYFSENKVFLKIIDFKDEQIFKSRMTYTCICILEKKQSEFIYYTASKEINLQDISKLEFNQDCYQNLDTQKGWSLKNSDLVNKLESIGKSFEKIYSTKSGIATLKNNVYIFKAIDDDKNSKYFYMSDGTEIEKEVCKEVINTNQLNTCIDIDSLKEKIIFPYTYIQNQAVIIEEDVFSKQFPKAYKYLLTKKDILATRDKGNGKYPVWYAFGRTQSLEKVKDKLFFPQLVKKGFKAIINDEEDLYFYNGMAAYTKDKRNLKILEKLLVSDVMWSYIENKSKHYASGYFGLGKNYLKDFGIYDFTDDEIEYIINEKDIDKLNKFFTSLYKIRDLPYE